MIPRETRIPPAVSLLSLLSLLDGPILCDCFDPTKASSDNYVSRFNNARGARARGDQFGHPDFRVATERAQFTACQRELSAQQIHFLNPGLLALNDVFLPLNSKYKPLNVMFKKLLFVLTVGTLMVGCNAGSEKMQT